eukprot:1149435-Pelagomonas_calceolata.AAC.1
MGLDHQSAIKLAHKLHAHSVQYAYKLVIPKRAIDNKKYFPQPGRVSSAYACTAPLPDAKDIALPDARDPFYNFYWLSLKSSHDHNGEPYHPHTASTYYLTNLTGKPKRHMHKRHKLSSADTSSYY